MITRLLTVLMFCFVTLAVTANNGVTVPANLEDGRSIIAMETMDIEAIETIIENEGLTYAELAEKYPNLVANANIASSANEEGLFDSSSDAPLGIGGFWWGLVLGCLGVLIVYIAMDEGSDRKEQVRSSLIGCLISAALSSIWTFVLR